MKVMYQIVKDVEEDLDPETVALSVLAEHPFYKDERLITMWEDNVEYFLKPYGIEAEFLSESQIDEIVEAVDKSLQTLIDGFKEIDYL